MKHTPFSLLILTALLILSSCSAINRRAEPPDFQTRQNVLDGEYGKVLTLLLRICSLDDAGRLPEQCRLNVEQVRELAEQSFEQGDFVKAGSLYRILMQSGNTFPFDAAQAKRGIEKCSRTLTGEGLMRYREENLDAAISLWEKVLFFDPQNEAVKKAIATASKQRQRLKTMR